LEIASWFPFGVDYQPVSINRLYSPQLRRVAAQCLALDSEFLFMASPQTGCIGSLMRDNFYRADPYGLVSLGFMMILGYSPRMERLVADALEEMKKYGDLSAGVAFCSLWNQGVLVGSLKAIAVVSNGPFFEEAEFMDGFEGFLSGRVKGKSAVAVRQRGRRSSKKKPPQKEDELPFLRKDLDIAGFVCPTRRMTLCSSGSVSFFMRWSLTRRGRWWGPHRSSPSRRSWVSVWVCWRMGADDRG
jgi:hypothetical protein